VKFWISKNSEVSIHEQIMTQVRLGVASRDLLPGERLPSTRELARRFKIHQNTVSAAFRELAADGVVEFKKGSGVFVAELTDGIEKPRLEDIFSQFLDRAAAAGYSRQEVEEHLWERLESRRPSGLLVIESDEALRRILIEEIEQATGIRAEGVSFESFAEGHVANGTPLAAMFDEKEKLRPALPSGSACIFLDANSVPGSLSGRTRPSPDDLIAIVSGWEKFIALAKLFLAAARLEPEMFVARLTAEDDWRKGIDQASLIICDSLTARQFPDDPRVQVFPLIAAASLEKIKELA
jgi:DNA-binding transcriptional regulator YhcF (GntR family)